MCSEEVNKLPKHVTKSQTNDSSKSPCSYGYQAAKIPDTIKRSTKADIICPPLSSIFQLVCDSAFSKIYTVFFPCSLVPVSKNVEKPVLDSSAYYKRHTFNYTALWLALTCSQNYKNCPTKTMVRVFIGEAAHEIRTYCRFLASLSVPDGEDLLLLVVLRRLLHK